MCQQVRRALQQLRIPAGAVTSYSGGKGNPEGQAELGTPETKSSLINLWAWELNFLLCCRGDWSMEVYSCWPLQKYLGETALFMESCMPYLGCFLLCIPLSLKITPRDGCPDVWPTLGPG